MTKKTLLSSSRSDHEHRVRQAGFRKRNLLVSFLKIETTPYPDLALEVCVHRSLVVKHEPFKGLVGSVDSAFLHSSIGLYLDSQVFPAQPGSGD